MNNSQRKEALVIGSGIAGMTCALRLAEAGVFVTLASPYPSERAQSVMAAGGINAVCADHEEGDSVACHIEDTLKGGGGIAGRQAVTGLCARAEEILSFLERIGTVFTTDEQGRPARRAFGGQSFRRTYYCGSATGKQIVSALVMEVRRLETEGRIRRRLWSSFHSALIRDGVCYGAILFDERTGELEALHADATVIATGGQNALFGKTTGTTNCDGYAAGRLFLQGAELKNLEFIQYHPTTLETPQKRMLISEAVRGEGGRLFYEENGERVYFMERKYGPTGNLMTRDVTSREIEACGRDVYLDISFLDGKTIDRRLPEVRDLCRRYGGIDIKKEPVPVAPSVHFFMGGLAVHADHKTNISGLYAIGECASIYHGANRLGGNSLLAALYGGTVAAESIAEAERADDAPDFTEELNAAVAELSAFRKTDSPFPVLYIREMASEIMRKNLGIVRNEAMLRQGISDIEYYLSVADRIAYDSSVTLYQIYSLKAILSLAKAVLTCALSRTESRGSHFREDYPKTEEAFAYATIISCGADGYRVRLDRERIYES